MAGLTSAGLSALTAGAAAFGGIAGAQLGATVPAAASDLLPEAAQTPAGEIQPSGGEPETD